MVPHGGLEASISTLIGQDTACAVTSVSDPTRGERLVAFYTDTAMSPSHLWEALCRTTLPRLWLPKREDLHVVESIPTLVTGKVDLRALRQLAVDKS